MNPRPALLLAFSLAAIARANPSATPTPGKSRHHVFNPTPREMMREMSTDRPDKTESPYTVDAGHVQIETDVAALSYDRHNPERTDTRAESWSFGATNFKLGLLNNVDVQFVVEPYNHVRTDDRTAHAITRQSGFGDLTTRVKVNLWGNDGGRTALALMPFVKFPINQDDLGNNAVEGGLIIPLAVDLPSGWSMGLMTEIDFIEDGDGSDHHAEWINSITFSHDIVGRLGGYVEFFSLVTNERGVPWVGTLDAGFTFAISDDIQLDAGVNIGLTRSADDVNPFVGLSWRF